MDAVYCSPTPKDELVFLGLGGVEATTLQIDGPKGQVGEPSGTLIGGCVAGLHGCGERRANRRCAALSRSVRVDYRVGIVSHAFLKIHQTPNERFLSLSMLRAIRLLLGQMHKTQRLANKQWHPWRLLIRNLRQQARPVSH